MIPLICYEAQFEESLLYMIERLEREPMISQTHRSQGMKAVSLDPLGPPTPERVEMFASRHLLYSDPSDPVPATLKSDVAKSEWLLGLAIGPFGTD